MSVNSHAIREKRRPTYLCNHAYSDAAPPTCQRMTAKPVDDCGVALFFEALAPAQVQSALQAVEQLEHERQALQQQWEQQWAQARYEVQLAQRQ